VEAVGAADRFHHAGLGDVQIDTDGCSVEDVAGLIVRDWEQRLSC
jgi:hypothetical protein